MADETLIYTSKHYDSGEDIDAAIWHDNRDALEQITDNFINILKDLKEHKPIYKIDISETYKKNNTSYNSPVSNLISNGQSDIIHEKAINITFPFQIPTSDLRSDWNENLDYVLKKGGYWEASTNYWKKENNILSLNSNFFSYDNDYISLGYNPEDNNSGDPYKFVFGIGDSNTKISAFSIRNSGRIYARNFNPANLFGVIECYNSELNPNEVRATLKNPKLENSIIESSTIQGDTKINNNIYSSSTVPFIETMPGTISGTEKTIIQEKYNVDYCRPIKIPYDSIPTGLAISTKIDNSINGSTNTPYLRIQLSNVKENDIKDIEIKSPNGSAITCAKIADKMITVRYYSENFYLASGGGCDFLDIKTELTAKDIMNDDEWADANISIIAIKDNKIYGTLFDYYYRESNRLYYYKYAYFYYDIKTKNTKTIITSTSKYTNAISELYYYEYNNNNSDGRFFEFDDAYSRAWNIINIFEEENIENLENISSCLLYSIKHPNNSEKIIRPKNIYFKGMHSMVGVAGHATFLSPRATHTGQFFSAGKNNSTWTQIDIEDGYNYTGSYILPEYIQIGNIIIGDYFSGSNLNNSFIGYIYPSSISLKIINSSNYTWNGCTDMTELVNNPLCIIQNDTNGYGETIVYLLNNNQLIKYVITMNSITRTIEKTFTTNDILYNISASYNTTGSYIKDQTYVSINNDYYIIVENKLVNILNNDDIIDLNIDNNYNINYVASDNIYTIIQRDNEFNKLYILY